MRGIDSEFTQTTLEPVAKGRPWEPFKLIPIRLFGNNKTAKGDHSHKEWGRKNILSGGNCIDPVRGCAGGRTNGGLGCPWGCYSKESSRRFHRIFDQPVSMVLKEHLLRKDLEQLAASWVRIGVNGDPCFDWLLTAKICEICSEYKKTPVVISRFWKRPDELTLRRLAKAGVVLHGSMCAIDSEGMQEHVLGILEHYRELGVAVLRLVTFAFAEGDELWDVQDKLAEWGLVLEQPARLMRTNPSFERVDQSRYEPYRSHVSGKINPRWRTAGQLYSKLLACVTECYDCTNKCITK